MTCCKSELYGNWCRIFPTQTDEQGQEYCAFHAPKNHPEKDSFNVLFQKLIQEDSQQINLAGTIFPDIFSWRVEPDDIQSINFQDCIFEEKFIFYQSNIKGKLDFSNATFKDECRLEKITCNQLLLSNSNCENSELSLNEISCNYKFSFKNAILPSSVGISFHTVPTEIDLTCKNYRRLGIYTHENNSKKTRRLQLPTDYTKDGSILIQNLNFTQIELHKITPKTLFKNCSFETLTCSSSGETRVITFDACRFKKIHLTASTLDLVKFYGCIFPKYNGRSIITDSLKELNVSPTNKKCEQLDNSFCKLEEIYRKLKKLARTDEANMLASDWHYWEKFFCEKKLSAQGNKSDALILRLYRYASDYSENASKACCVLFLMLIFAIVLGILKYTGVYIAHPEHHLFFKCTFPTGLGLKTPTGYYTIKYFWHEFNIYKALQTTFDFVPLATKSPDTSFVSLWRPLELFYQAIITFQVTLLGFALHNRYRK